MLGILYDFCMIFAAFLICSTKSQNRYITECDDPLILDHEMRHGHPYCERSCGENTVATCNQQKMCICTSPCFEGDAPTGKPLAPDVCPTTDLDPNDPGFFLTCHIACTMSCQGGRGTVCGESDTLTDPAFPMTFATICNCVCPPSTRCPAPANATIQIPNIFIPLAIKKFAKSLVVAFAGIYIILGFLFKLFIFNVLAILGAYFIPNVFVDNSEFDVDNI